MQDTKRSTAHQLCHGTSCTLRVALLARVDSLQYFSGYGNRFRDATLLPTDLKPDSRYG
jgi:hypothetical protein